MYYPFIFETTSSATDDAYRRDRAEDLEIGVQDTDLAKVDPLAQALDAVTVSKVEHEEADEKDDEDDGDDLSWSEPRLPTVSAEPGRIIAVVIVLGSVVG